RLADHQTAKCGGRSERDFAETSIGAAHHSFVVQHGGVPVHILIRGEVPALSGGTIFRLRLCFCRGCPQFRTGASGVALLEFVAQAAGAAGTVGSALHSRGFWEIAGGLHLVAYLAAEPSQAQLPAPGTYHGEPGGYLPGARNACSK